MFNSITKAELDCLRSEFPQGTRVKLVKMNDPYTKLEPGTEGTVTGVDDIGTIHVNWDNGSCIGVAYGEDKCKQIRLAEPAGDSNTPAVVEIKVPAEKYDLYNQLINDQQMFEGCGKDDLIEVFIARFTEHIEADIKVCNSKDGPWIDPVLFWDGSQIDLLDPDFELDGDYEFEYEGATYIVRITRGN